MKTDQVRGSRLRSRGGRIVGAIVMVNVAPFLALAATTEGPFATSFAEVFMFLSAPYWLMVIGIWFLARNLSPVRRVVAAEVLPGAVQAYFLIFFWPYPLVAIRVIDGVLLYAFTLTSSKRTFPIEAHTS